MITLWSVRALCVRSKRDEPSPVQDVHYTDNVYEGGLGAREQLFQVSRALETF